MKDKLLISPEQMPGLLMSILGETVSSFPKHLAIITTGAGGYWGNLINFPGASRILKEVQIPYSHEAFMSLVDSPVVADANGTQFLTINNVPVESENPCRDYAHEFAYAPRTVTTTFSSVSVEAVEVMQRYLKKKWGNDVVKVACTAALTTNRYRRGEDQAFIAVNDDIYHVHLPKLTEEEYNKMDAGEIIQFRHSQDLFLMLFIYDTINGTPFEAPEGVTIERIN